MLSLELEKPGRASFNI